MIGLIRALALWVIGIIVALLLNKTELKLLAKTDGILDKGTQDATLFDIQTTKKHFIATFILNCLSLLVATFIPISFFKWIFFIGCGMLLAPVFYNVVYVCLPQTFKSKIRLCLTLSSVLNIILIAYTLIYIYFGYIQRSFV